MIWIKVLPFGFLVATLVFAIEGKTLYALMTINASLLAMILSTLHRR